MTLLLHIVIPNAEQLVRDMQKITEVVIRENLRHAMVPNLRRGKTEIQLILKGQGSKRVKAELYNIEEPFIHIEGVPDEYNKVLLVATYRHLGTRVDVTRRMRREIQSRFGQAYGVFKKYRRAIFQNPLLSRDRRTFLFRSLVMAVLEYNVGTWGHLTKAEEKVFNSKLMGLYRGLARGEVKEPELRMWSNDRVRAFLQLPSGEDILHGARIRYSMSLHKSAPHLLWHLIACEKHWLHQLHRAHEWLYFNVFGYGPDSQGNAWQPDIHEWCMNGDRQLRTWLRKATEHSIWQHVKHVEWREWHFHFIQSCINLGLQVEIPVPTGQSRQGKEEAEACLQCGLVFAGRAGWAVHAFKKHQRVAEARRVVDGTRCASCSREYGSTVRLQHHLRHSKKCYRKLLNSGRWKEEVLPGQGNNKVPKERQLRAPSHGQLWPSRAGHVG